MRKFKTALAVLMLIAIISPGLAFSQSDSRMAVSVDRKGVMRDETGQVIDYRLFAFSSYDKDGKRRMKKGKARNRPNIMYLEKSLLSGNNLDDKSSGQWQEYRAYMAAEKSLSARRSLNSIRRKANQTNTPRTQAVTTTVSRLENLTDAQLDDLAEKTSERVISKLPANDKFQQKLANLINAKLSNQQPSNGSSPQSEPTATPAANETENSEPGFFSRLGTSIAGLYYDTINPWMETVLYILLGIVVIGSISYLFLGKPQWARKIRDKFSQYNYRRFNNSELRIKSTEHVSIINSDTESVTPPAAPNVTTDDSSVDDGFTKVTPRSKPKAGPPADEKQS